jgi:hypothetical protein
MGTDPAVGHFPASRAPTGTDPVRRAARTHRPPGRDEPYWYEIMLGVGFRVMVCAGVSIGESSS